MEYFKAFIKWCVDEKIDMEGKKEVYLIYFLEEVKKWIWFFSERDMKLLLNFTDFIIYRENYIRENNSEYNDKKIDDFLKQLWRIKRSLSFRLFLVNSFKSLSDKIKLFWK